MSSAPTTPKATTRIDTEQSNTLQEALKSTLHSVWPDVDFQDTAIIGIDREGMQYILPVQITRELTDLLFSPKASARIAASPHSSPGRPPFSPRGLFTSPRSNVVLSPTAAAPTAIVAPPPRIEQRTADSLSYSPFEGFKDKEDEGIAFGVSIKPFKLPNSIYTTDLPQPSEHDSDEEGSHAVGDLASPFAPESNHKPMSVKASPPYSAVPVSKPKTKSPASFTMKSPKFLPEPQFSPTIQNVIDFAKQNNDVSRINLILADAEILLKKQIARLQNLYEMLPDEKKLNEREKTKKIERNKDLSEIILPNLRNTLTKLQHTGKLGSINLAQLITEELKDFAKELKDPIEDRTDDRAFSTRSGTVPILEQPPTFAGGLGSYAKGRSSRHHLLPLDHPSSPTYPDQHTPPAIMIGRSRAPKKSPFNSNKITEGLDEAARSGNIDLLIAELKSKLKYLNKKEEDLSKETRSGENNKKQKEITHYIQAITSCISALEYKETSPTKGDLSAFVRSYLKPPRQDFAEILRSKTSDVSRAVAAVPREAFRRSLSPESQSATTALAVSSAASVVPGIVRRRLDMHAPASSVVGYTQTGQGQSMPVLSRNRNAVVPGMQQSLPRAVFNQRQAWDEEPLPLLPRELQPQHIGTSLATARDPVPATTLAHTTRPHTTVVPASASNSMFPSAQRKRGK